MSKSVFILRKMVKQGSSAKRFFRVILTEVIESGNLELPTSFLKKHGKNLSNYATLKVPTGEESKMEIKRSKGQAWLHKGWAKFVVKYSIKCRYFLVFRYKGGSRFTVLIFDHTSLEILYPPSSANACKLVKVKEEESDDADEILDEHPHKFQRVSENRNRNLVMEKAKAFQSSNPHFSVMMKPVYMPTLYIPAEPGRSYFSRAKRNNMMKLIGEDGRTWSMKYSIGIPPTNRVMVGSGWPMFLKENGVQEGDVCVFELVSSSTMTFKVTLFRVAEHEEEANKENPSLISTAAASASCKNKMVSSNTASTVMERVENFKCKNPHFIIRMTSYTLSDRSTVHIPVAHSRKYLKKENSITILDGSNGKNWLVYFTPTAVKLSKGWKDFASANRLQVGDVLVLEMMNGKPKTYKANIFRV